MILKKARHGQKKAPCSRVRNRGFTLVEAIIATTIAGLVMAFFATYIVESAMLSLRITQTLEHSRSARELIDTLSADIRSTQVMYLYPGYSNRTPAARDGQAGNYLVLQSVDDAGAITRTVGYYTVSMGDGAGWTVYRHDSNLGDNKADGLPSTASQGSHRPIKRVLRLPDNNSIFRCVRDRGISIHGEFGPADAIRSKRTEFIQSTILTRS